MMSLGAEIPQHPFIQLASPTPSRLLNPGQTPTPPENRRSRPLSPRPLGRQSPRPLPSTDPSARKPSDLRTLGRSRLPRGRHEHRRDLLDDRRRGLRRLGKQVRRRRTGAAAFVLFVFSTRSGLWKLVEVARSFPWFQCRFWKLRGGIEAKIDCFCVQILNS